MVNTPRRFANARSMQKARMSVCRLRFVEGNWVRAPGHKYQGYYQQLFKARGQHAALLVRVPEFLLYIEDRFPFRAV